VYAQRRNGGSLGKGGYKTGQDFKVGTKRKIQQLGGEFALKKKKGKKKGGGAAKALKPNKGSA